MKIEQGTARSDPPYWTVLVDPNELVVESGKRLPYSTWIGTIGQNGKIRVWTPAAYVPRGYPKAAKEMLEQALSQLRSEGKVKAAPKTPWGYK
jgi:tripartite-type tricarboxylate transporter receptor subunit TctC